MRLSLLRILLALTAVFIFLLGMFVSTSRVHGGIALGQREHRPVPHAAASTAASGAVSAVEVGGICIGLVAGMLLAHFVIVAFH